MIKFPSINHFSLSALILFSSVLTLHADALPFKEATIHYKITGNTTGTQITYIRNYGQERVTYRKTNSKIMHPNSADRQLIMITPEWKYHINLSTHKGTREPYINPLNTEKTQEKSLLGLACQKKIIDGKSSFVTKEGSLLLKSHVRILGYKEDIIATDITRGTVDDALFRLPQGLHIVEKNL